MRSYRLCVCLYLFVIIVATGCHSGKQASIKELKTDKKQYLDSLNVELQGIAVNSHIPGFAASIIQNDKILFSKGFGYSDLKNKAPFTIQTINSVASISKTFIGLSILKLVEEGKLNLDEPINSILPYKIINPFYPDKEITVRHLVTHTSSISQEFDPEEVGESTIILFDSFDVNQETPASLKKEIAYYKLGKYISIDQHIKKFTQPSGNWYTENNFLKHPPGSKFNYTNLGALIAARIVEIKSGFSFEEYTRHQIFEPLNMANTAWHYKELNSSLFSTLYTFDDRKNPTKVLVHPKYEMTDYPVGGLKTNVEDLTKYLLEIIKGYNGKGELLTPASYQILLNPQLADSCFENRNDYIFNDQYNMGVLWSISAPGYRMHNGGTIGVYSFIYFNPKTGMGALSFCNLPDNDFGKIRDIVHKYEILLSQ
jgi:CubicO group peptidase (beta-lactamase class C family)